MLHTIYVYGENIMWVLGAFQINNMAQWFLFTLIHHAGSELALGNPLTWYELIYLFFEYLQHTPHTHTHTNTHIKLVQCT